MKLYQNPNIPTLLVPIALFQCPHGSTGDIIRAWSCGPESVPDLAVRANIVEWLARADIQQGLEAQTRVPAYRLFLPFTNIEYAEYWGHYHAPGDEAKPAVCAKISAWLDENPAAKAVFEAEMAELAADWQETGEASTAKALAMLNRVTG